MTLRTYIDGNSIGYAASARKGKRLTAGSQETTAIYGALGTIRKILESSISRPVTLWDGRSWRYERFADYKGTRDDTPEKVADRERYKAQKSLLVRALHYLGMPQLIAGNMEADDLAAIMTRRALRMGDQVILVTGDKDWIQLVENGVVWDDHKIDRKCTAANFHEFTKFRTQKAFIHAKALQGDDGDNVKPKTGVGEKGAIDMLAVFDDVHEFLQANIATVEGRMLHHHGVMPRTWSGLKKFHADTQAQVRFEFALELMDLGHPSIPQPTNLRATRGDIDLKAFSELCAQLSFGSILRNVEVWAKPFIQAQEKFA
jgi:5'-3' exonuclease